MCNSDHFIKLLFADSHACTLGGVIEATGLFLNAFVEGEVVHERTYVLSIECVSPKEFVIRATPRHPLEESKFAQDRAYTPLYVLFVAWFLAGANVEIEGPWADSLPGRGTLAHPSIVPLQLRPVFQDGLPLSERTVYPSLEDLAEIHSTTIYRDKWNEIKVNPAFKDCFPEVSPDPRAPNNIRLSHRNGLHVDLILDQGGIASHIIECIQDEFDARFTTCDRQVSEVRTWWDAWIAHCPTTDLTPKHLLILPDEVSLISISGSIWRYRLQKPKTLERLMEVDFGDGVEPTRPVDSWLQLACRFGEAGALEIAIACCEQAIASATAMVADSPGLTIKSPLGVSPRQQLNDAETEYLRWLDYKESLNKPALPHDRWSDRVMCKGVHELTKQLGSQWEPALEALVEAINQEHYDAQDYHRSIGGIREFFWNVNGEIGRLRFNRLFGQELMDAKVPKRSLSMLGYEFSGEVIPSYWEFSDIFSLNLGKARFWGSVEKRVLVSCSEPSKVFQL